MDRGCGMARSTEKGDVFLPAESDASRCGLFGKLAGTCSKLAGGTSSYRYYYTNLPS